MLAGPRTLTLIGLDPGLRRTGWGVITMSGNRLSRVAEGVVQTDQGLTLAERLAHLYRGLVAILERYRPDEAAVEETFVNTNAVSTLKLGVARGVVLLAPAEMGLPVAEYASTAVKKAVVGTGHADKTQVQMMVCHAHHAGSRRLDALARAAAS
jgi:crossover junction endodeoxyribonuclease RuvC